MELKKWFYYNHGLSVNGIAKKNLKYKDITGILNIVEEIPNLNNNEYIKITIDQEIFPFFKRWEMTSRDFKKRGNQFNLNLGTKENMIKNRVTPHKKICDTIAKTYHDLKLLEELTYYDVLTNREIYDKICRRGLKWNRRESMLHTLMPQRSLSRAWRLASLIINEDMNLKYSNPGNIFFIEIPSTTKDPKSFRYAVKIYNFATKFPSAYGDWQMLDGQIGSLDEEFKKAIDGIDMYSPASKRYKIQEFRLNFQLITAAILRQHFNDDRMHQDKFKNFKRVQGQDIEPVKLNVPIPPTKRRIILDWKIDNNVVLEYKTKKRKIELKKLNEGERELIFSLDTYLNHLKGENSHIIDEELHSLDEIVKKHREIIGF